MFYTGKTIKFYENDAIVLTCLENEVLLFLGKNDIRWVDKDYLEMVSETKPN